MLWTITLLIAFILGASGSFVSNYGKIQTNMDINPSIVFDGFEGVQQIIHNFEGYGGDSHCFKHKISNKADAVQYIDWIHTGQPDLEGISVTIKLAKTEGIIHPPLKLLPNDEIELLLCYYTDPLISGSYEITTEFTPIEIVPPEGEQFIVTNLTYPASIEVDTQLTIEFDKIYTYEEPAYVKYGLERTGYYKPVRKIWHGYLIYGEPTAHSSYTEQIGIQEDTDWKIVCYRYDGEDYIQTDEQFFTIEVI